MAYDPTPTKPMFTTVQYCLRCGMPSAERDLTYDELGVCNICQSAEQKMALNWVEREKELRDTLDRFRGREGTDYDCIVPISGGKDSAFQLYLITQVYKLKPLAVTFSHNWYSETGMKNLRWCLETFDCDHIMFTPSRSVVNRAARRSLEMIGDSCWHCHAGVGAFPLQIAVKYNIPLLIWGESVAEHSGMSNYNTIIKFDREYFKFVSSRFEHWEMATDYMSVRDLSPFALPSWEEVEKLGLVGIHLGDHVFWDAERQVELLRDLYGWQEDTVEGTYKCYKSVECVMPGVHDYTKFLKRGYGRATDHASQDCRAGLMTREEANEYIREHDPKRPGILDYYLKSTGYSEEEFYRIMDQQREATGVISRAEIDAAIADHKKRFGG